jgi:alpha-galactosidase/6-phospho-beta-glucosidase family protein
MPKIAIIGAGSAVFSKNIIADVLWHPALREAEIAIIRTNINVQDLAVRGILELSKDYLYQAAMLDPNTAATLTLTQIKAVMDALFEAHLADLPAGFRFQGTCHLPTT